MAQVYVYPDGTASVHEPSDGQVFMEWDVSQKVKRVWQYDGFKRQWFDVTVSGKPIPYAFTRKMDETDEEFRKRVTGQITIQKTKCECGSEKCGSSKHSSWCPKYQS